MTLFENIKQQPSEKPAELPKYPVGYAGDHSAEYTNGHVSGKAAHIEEDFECALVKYRGDVALASMHVLKGQNNGNGHSVLIKNEKDLEEKVIENN